MFFFFSMYVRTPHRFLSSRFHLKTLAGQTRAFFKHLAPAGVVWCGVVMFGDVCLSCLYLFDATVSLENVGSD